MINEALFVVTTDDDGFVVRDPSGVEWRASWRTVERMSIHTTDAGPFVADVFWEVQTGAASIVFPGGATGEDAFLQFVQTHLPKFNNDQVIAAMTSTDNRTFVVWERER